MRKIKITAPKMGLYGVTYYRLYQPLLKLAELYPDEFSVCFANDKDIMSAISNTDIFFASSLTGKLWIDIFKKFQEINRAEVADGLPKVNFIIDYDDDVHNVDVSNPVYATHGLQECIAKFNDGTMIIWKDNITKVDIQGEEVTFNIERNKKMMEDIKGIQAQADYLTCTTDYLAGRLRQYNPNVKVLPNGVDVDLYGHIPNDTGFIRVGWIIGGSHLHDYMELRDSIAEVLKEYKNVKFILMHNGAAPSKGIPAGQFERIPGTRIDHGYFRLVSNLKLDINIASVEETPFTLSKSNLKWLEGAALGIPTIASHTLYGDYIRDGVDGFIFKDKKEFKKKLIKLIQDEKLRRSIGSTAYNLIKDTYDIKIIVEKYRDFFKSIV